MCSAHTLTSHTEEWTTEGRKLCKIYDFEESIPSAVISCYRVACSIYKGCGTLSAVCHCLPTCLRHFTAVICVEYIKMSHFI